MKKHDLDRAFLIDSHLFVCYNLKNRGGCLIMIYGFGTKSKKTTYLGRRYCHNCDGFTNYYLYRQYSYYSVFFIPIIKITKAYFIGCDVCRLGTEINKEDAQALKEEYANFPMEPLLVKVINDIKSWAHEEGNKKTKEALIKQIDAYCYFKDKSDYLEQLIDDVCKIEKGKEVNELSKKT